MKCALHSPKPQHHWNLTIRLFSVIYPEDSLGGGTYPSAEKHSMYSTAPAVWAILQRKIIAIIIWSIIVIPIIIGTLGRILKGLLETGRLGNKRTDVDHPDYSITKISQNTEKSPGDLMRLAITQTPEKNHQVTLVWKTPKGVK